MSRRTRLGPDSTLLMQQRRGVPNARMWSEAPFHAPAGWDGLETEPDYVKPVVLPSGYRMGTWPMYGPGAAAVPITNYQSWFVEEKTLGNSHGGTEHLGIVTARGIPSWTPDPSWEVVATGSDGTEYVRYWVLRRTQPDHDANFLIPVGTYTTSGGAGTYAGARFICWWFRDMSGGKWTVKERGSGTSSPVRFTAADPADTFRMQVFPSTGFSVNWSGAYPPGFDLSTFGYIGGETGYDRALLANSSDWPDPRPRFNQPFVEGDFTAVNGGRWIELHISYG